MANVLFKTGLQANLDTIRDNLSATEGTFYLTSDTHRLYIGRITSTAEGSRTSTMVTNAGGTTKQDATHCDAVPVNQGVTAVKTLANLPTVTAGNESQYVGQFYYITDNNILCVYSASSVSAGDQNHGGWVQINPNTDTKVEGLEIGISVANGVATVTTTVKSTTASGATGGDSYHDDFTIAGAGGTTVSATGDAITITSEQYDLNSSVSSTSTGGGTGTATLNLTSSDAKDDSAVKLVAGANVKITAGTTDATHEVVVEATNTELKSATGGSGDGAASNPSSNGFHITVTDTGDNSKTGAIDPLVAVGKDTSVSGNTVHFVNGTATLPVYSKSDIDTMLKGFQAMEFKGVITTAPSNSDQSLGYTYKVGDVAEAGILITNGDGTTTVTAHKGDLVIASDGTEDATTGKITSGLVWEVITAGDDTTVTYDGESITHGVQLKESTGDVVAKMDLTAGTAIELSDTTNKTGTGTTIGTNVTIKHADVTRAADSTTATYTQKYGETTNSTVEAITGITTNAQGHVTGVTKTKWTLLDTNGKVSAVNTQISATPTPSDSTNAGTKYTATFTNGVRTLSSDNTQTGYQEASYKIESSSLQISATAATIDGTTKVQSAAGTMTIDMVWGTF